MELESKLRWYEMEEQKLERRLLNFGATEMRDKEGKMRLLNVVVGNLASYWSLALSGSYWTNNPSLARLMVARWRECVAEFLAKILGFLMCNFMIQFRRFKIPNLYQFPSNRQNVFEEFCEVFYVSILIVSNPNLSN